MSDWTPNRIAILGAGAMGCLFGGKLRAGGLDVHLVDTWSEHVNAINTHGLRFEGFGGAHTVDIPAYVDANLVGPVDLVVVQCKALHTAAALSQASALFTDHTLAVSFQNGLGNEELIAEHIGSERVLGGLTAQGATMTAPGVVHNWGELPSYVGEMPGGMSARVTTLCDAFTDASLDTHASSDIRKEIWKKLLGNIGLSPTSAITRLTSAELMGVPELSVLVFGAVDEAAAVAQAEGVELDVAEARSVLLKLTETDGGGTGNSRSSACVDLLNGRNTEVDWINGSVVRLGAKHGIPTPFNSALVGAVKGIERFQELERAR
jgi:2-dehydropantoate 2-reductase